MEDVSIQHCVLVVTPLSSRVVLLDVRRARFLVLLPGLALALGAAVLDLPAFGTQTA